MTRKKVRVAQRRKGYSRAKKKVKPTEVNHQAVIPIEDESRHFVPQPISSVKPTEVNHQAVSTREDESSRIVSQQVSSVKPKEMNHQKDYTSTNKDKSSLLVSQPVTTCTVKPMEVNHQKFYINKDYSSHLVSQLAQMWRNQELCDVTITAGNTVITKAHRVVLVASCPALRVTNASSSYVEKLEVNFGSDATEEAVSAMLQYIYEGSMLLTKNNVYCVYKVASQLKVENICMCCLKFLKELEKLTRLNVKKLSSATSTSNNNCIAQSSYVGDPTNYDKPTGIHYSLSGIGKDSLQSMSCETDIKQEKEEMFISHVVNNDDTQNVTEDICAKRIKLEPDLDVHTTVTSSCDLSPQTNIHQTVFNRSTCTSADFSIVRPPVPISIVPSKVTFPEMTASDSSVTFPEMTMSDPSGNVSMFYAIHPQAAKVILSPILQQSFNDRTVNTASTHYVGSSQPQLQSLPIAANSGLPRLQRPFVLSANVSEARLTCQSSVKSPLSNVSEKGQCSLITPVTAVKSPPTIAHEQGHPEQPSVDIPSVTIKTEPVETESMQEGDYRTQYNDNCRLLEVKTEKDLGENTPELASEVNNGHCHGNSNGGVAMDDNDADSSGCDNYKPFYVKIPTVSFMHVNSDDKTKEPVIGLGSVFDDNISQTTQIFKKVIGEKGKVSFQPINEDEMKVVIETPDLNSTEKVTIWGLNYIQDWSREELGSDIDFATISAEDLGSLLCKFYSNAVSKNSKNKNEGVDSFFSSTVRSIRTSINRHLRDLNRNIDITRDTQFKKANGIFSLKVRDELLQIVYRGKRRKLAQATSAMDMT